MKGIHVIPVPGEADRFIVYRPAAQVAFVANGRLARELTPNAAPGAQRDRLASEVRAFLDALGFWRAPVSAHTEGTARAFAPTTAVLLLTNRCNLRCVYCYADAGVGPAREMPEAIGHAAIDQVCQQAVQQGLDRFRVDFHGGGEPTAAWRPLQACAAHARTRPLPAVVSLTSNAAWSPAVRDWIIQHVDELSLSVDGGPATQNRNRPLAQGGESFGLVDANLRALDDAGRTYGVRVTASPPWDPLADDVRSLCEHPGCVAIQVEPTFDTRRGGHRLAPTVEDCQSFVAAFVAAFEVGRALGRPVFYSGARVGVQAATFCEAPYGALIVTPEGNLSTCYEVDGPRHPLFSISHIGRILGDRIEVDDERRAALHALMAQRRQVCDSCFCASSCAGDCYTRTFAPGADGHLRYGARCDMNRAIFVQILLRLMADGDGFWRLPDSYREDDANAVG
jgi:uncharacterized protein